MVALLRRNVGQQAPDGAVSVDWGHPLASGLQFAVVLSPGRAPIDLVTGSGPVVGGSPKLVPTHGGSMRFGSGDYLEFPLGASRFQKASGLSVMWRGKFDSSSGYGHFVSYGVGGGVNGAFDWYRETGSTTNSSLWRASSPIQFNSGAVGDMTSLPRTLLMATSAAASTRLHCDGRDVDGGGSLATPSAADSALRIGRRSDGATQLVGECLLVYIWDRPLRADLARWAHTEPYAMLTQGPLRSVFWLGSVASAFRPQIVAA